MKTRRPPRPKQSAILVALLLSLLLHQVILTAIGAIWKIPTPEQDEPRQVMLLKDPEPPKAPEQPQPQMAKPVPQPRPKRRPRVSPPPSKVAETVPKETVSTEPPPALAGLLPAGPEPEPQPKIKLNLNWSGFERTFNAQAQSQRNAYVEESLERRRTRGSFGSKFSGKVRRAIATNHGWIKAGNQEPLGRRQRTFRNYIEAIHDKIHFLFADSFLASLTSFAPDDPLNDFSLHTVMEFEILANGHLNEVRIVRSSGNTVFDAGAVDSLYRSAPYQRPPKTILSWNDRVYMRWGFYRNQRKCGVFNAEPYILKAPGAKPQPISPEKFIIEDG